MNVRSKLLVPPWYDAHRARLLDAKQAIHHLVVASVDGSDDADNFLEGKCSSSAEAYSGHLDCLSLWRRPCCAGCCGRQGLRVE
jgi:hypothetical protein